MVESDPGGTLKTTREGFDKAKAAFTAWVIPRRMRMTAIRCRGDTLFEDRRDNARERGGRDGDICRRERGTILWILSVKN